MNEIRTKSLREKGMLVGFTASVWEGRVFDRKLSEETADQKKAQHGSFLVSKYLVSREIVKKASKIVTDFRNYSYKVTLPWMNDGTRILPNHIYMEYSTKAREAEIALEAAAQWFAEHIEELKLEAIQKLGGFKGEGGAYDPSDFPKDIAKRFRFKVHYSPIPDTEDFRITGFSDETAAALRKDIEESTKEMLRDSMREFWGKIQVLIERVIENMGKDPGKDKNGNDKPLGFHDSLIGNLQWMVENIPGFNFTNDPKLEEIRTMIEKKLTGFDAAELRRDRTQQEEAKKSAEAILKKMKQYTGAF